MAMRTSLTLVTLITTPVLLVACTQAPSEPIRGTVIGKEYEPDKPCPITTAKRKATKKPCTPTPECYELDIMLDHSGNVIEICDKAAFLTLDVEDRYSSTIDYDREEY